MSQASDPLDEEPYDPLDESCMVEDMDFTRGGPCDQEGFGATAAETRMRAGRLNSLRGRQIISTKKKRAFLAAFSQHGNVSAAAAAAGWSRKTAWAARKSDPDFGEMWDEAAQVAGDIIEMAVIQRAVYGVQEDVYHHGKEGTEVVGQVTKFDSSLLALLIKARKPEQYRERFEHKHEGGSKGGVLVVPGVIPLEQWSLAAAKQQAQYRETQED